MENTAYDYMPQGRELIGGEWVGEIDYEIIGGKKIYMVPTPNISHGIIVSRLVTMFNVYIWEHNIDAFTLADNADVYLADGSHFRPDVSVLIRKPKAINKEKFIDGAPDLVVEIISPSTAVRDKMDKFFAYEKYGVKEYWIVSPQEKSVEVYVLKENKLTRDGVYQFYTEEEFNDLTDRQKELVNREIKISLYDDFYITLEDIFENVK